MKSLSLLLTLLLSAHVVAGDKLTQARQQELQNMLKHDCGSCHGLTLKGGLGPSLLAKDLVHKNNEFLVNVILEGRKGTAMPPWNPFITKKEALWMVKTLLKK
jgi:cytochrome c55X